MIRRGCISALIAAAFLVSTPASGDSASAAKPTTNFATTLVIPMTFLGGGSAGFGIAGQTTDAYPRIGRASVDGALSFGSCNFFGCTYSSFLSLTFTTPSGDTLSLDGSVVGSPTPVSAAGSGTWSIDGGTGRFAGFAGSGTYSYTVEVTATYLATITLTGTFGHDG